MIYLSPYGCRQFQEQSCKLEVVRKGESPQQGIGYLPDGTMVVIEDGGEKIGEFVMIEVTNSLQTSAGRMIFANLAK